MRALAPVNKGNFLNFIYALNPHTHTQEKRREEREIAGNITAIKNTQNDNDNFLIIVKFIQAK